MKGFCREDRWFSLCGLNCGLCTMRLDGYCPGCGGGAGNQSCAIARCSLDRGGMAYCYQCGEYPCARYEKADEYDSFITHRNRRADMEKHRRLGPEAYGAVQMEKEALLQYLLATCNDGRRKSFFAAAVNLLELDALRPIEKRLAAESELPLRERAVLAADLCQAAAGEAGISLKLRRKPKK